MCSLDPHKKYVKYLHVCFWCKELEVLCLYKTPSWPPEWSLHAQWPNSKEQVYRSTKFNSIWLRLLQFCLVCGFLWGPSQKPSFVIVIMLWPMLQKPIPFFKTKNLSLYSLKNITPLTTNWVIMITYWRKYLPLQ